MGKGFSGDAIKWSGRRKGRLSPGSARHILSGTQVEMPFSPRTLPFCHLVAQIYTYSTCQQHARSPRLYFTLALRGQSRKTTCAESVAASPHYYDGFLFRPVLTLLLLLLRHKIAPPSVPRRLIMPVSSHRSQVGNDHRSQYSGTVYLNLRSAGSCPQLLRGCDV